MKKIDRHKTSFMLGLGNTDQAKKWLLANQSIRGVCFIGRSNVGKSSLINSFGNNTARVSNTPGKTREINIFNFSISNDENNEIEKRYFFDLPGYGYAKISKERIREWNTLMEAFFEYAPKGLTMINLRDSRHTAQDSDLKFLHFLESFNRDYMFVFNKIDKLKTQKDRARLAKQIKELKNKQPGLKCFKASAETKAGINELEKFIIDLMFESI